MKEIVKCILPIVSSAAIAAPVLISCGESINALPNGAFEWLENQTILFDLNREFTKWDNYDTIQIRSNVKEVVAGSLNGQELSNIKTFRIEQTEQPLTLCGGSVGALPSLERIIFKNTNYWYVKDFFLGSYTNLKVLDYSAVDNSGLNITPTIFNNFPVYDHDIQPGGTIYIKKGVEKDVIEGLFQVTNDGSPFFDWKVEYK